MRRPLRLEFHARIAIVLLALAALAPTLSRLIGASAAASFGQVCSAAGTGQTGSPADDRAAAPDCPMCLVPGLGLAPCGDVDASARLLALGDERPASLGQAARPQPAWRGAQARAPPLHG